MGSASVFLEPISCFYIAGIDPDAKYHLTLLVTRTRSGLDRMFKTIVPFKRKTNFLITLVNAGISI